MNRIDKVFSEIRFSGQISIIGKLSEIVKKFYPKEFSHWRIENNTIIRCHNSEQLENSTEIILIDHTKLVYSVEDPSTERYFIERLNKFYRMFDSFIESQEVIRIGIRSYTLLYQSNKSYTLNKYNNVYQNEFVNTIDTNEKPSDYLDIIEYNNKRITIGPLSKSENNKYLLEFTQKSKIYDNMILFDIDCWDNNIEKKRIPSSLERQYKNNRDISNSLTSFFGDKQ